MSKLSSFASLLVFVPLTVFVACGGETSSDTGSSGPQGGSSTAGSGSGAAGSGTAGSGAAGSGTAGSGTAGSGAGGTGTAGSGAAGSGATGGSPGMCKVDGDCPQPGAGCQQCPDGTAACTSAKCLGGKCVLQTSTCKTSCQPMNATGVGDCKAILGSKWNGSSCELVGGCSCSGSDCDKLTSEAECQSGHKLCQASDPCAGKVCGSPCSTCTGPDCPAVVEFCDASGKCGALSACPVTCQIEDAKGDGLCDAVLGYAWNGATCEAVTGCKCVGKDCGTIPLFKEVCVLSHQKCTGGGGPCSGLSCGAKCCPLGFFCEGSLPGICDDAGACLTTPVACPGSSCTPQEAAGNGLCDGFFGWAWTGKGCSQVTGCNCVGKECGALAKSIEACLAPHAACACEGKQCGDACPCLDATCANTPYQCDATLACKPGPQMCFFP